MGEPWTFEAIGTRWQIMLPSGEALSNATQGRVLERIKEFDQTYSRFRDDSWVSRLAEQAGSYAYPQDFQPLIQVYEDLYRITNGKITPLIGQTLVEAGYDAAYSLTPGDMSVPPRWDDVIELKENTITLEKPVLLDFGAAGKGYLVDIVTEILEEEGITEYVVDAGGDVRVRLSPNAPARIGLEHPSEPERIIGIAELTNGSICGSAGNRRKWAEFTHIIDPDLLSSPQHIQAVWVTSAEARVADAFATALFFIEPERLVSAAHEYSFEYLVVHSDYSYTCSDMFPAEIFLNAPL
jgi:thiamine biosynthesis lipoprotein